MRENNLDYPLGIRVKRANAVGERIFIEGNSAAALGCVYGGATVAAWYPITPSSSLAEAFTRHCRKFRTDAATGKARYAIIQAEDELASIGIVIGAAWNGARAFTCTSGPGISLMQEFIGLAYFAEVPAVLFDVQRGGPSTGMPTRTQQSDVLSCAYASHGDTKHVLLFPEDPEGSVRLRRIVFRPRRPLADADLRHARPRHRHAGLAMRAAVLGRQALARPRQGDDLRDARGGQRLRPLPGRRRRRHSLPHPSRNAPEARIVFHPRLDQGPVRALYRGWRDLCRQHAAPVAQVRDGEAIRAGAHRPKRRSGRRVLARSITGPRARRWTRRWRRLPRRESIVDTLRVRAFPFHDAVADFIAAHEQVFVIEQNRDAQLRSLLVNELVVDPAKLMPVLHYDGTPITARFIIGEIGDKLSMFNVTPLRKVAP